MENKDYIILSSVETGSAIIEMLNELQETKLGKDRKVIISRLQSFVGSMAQFKGKKRPLGMKLDSVHTTYDLHTQDMLYTFYYTYHTPREEVKNAT